MKTLIAILSFIPMLFCAQEEFTSVVENPNLNKSELYSNALSWFAKTFKSSNDVIQMKDAESGKIIAKGILNSAPTLMGVKGDGACWATITIICKDGKYKYEFTEIYFKYKAGGSYEYTGEAHAGEKKSHARWKEDVKTEINLMIIDLKAAMSKKDEF
jgi:hypothetical protein